MCSTICGMFAIVSLSTNKEDELSVMWDFLEYIISLIPLVHKKWNSPLRISSVNVAKMWENSGFGHIDWRKLHFLCNACHKALEFFLLPLK